MILIEVNYSQSLPLHLVYKELFCRPMFLTPESDSVLSYENTGCIINGGSMLLGFIQWSSIHYIGLIRNSLSSPARNLMTALMRVLMKVMRNLHKRKLRYCLFLSCLQLCLLKIVTILLFLVLAEFCTFWCCKGCH